MFRVIFILILLGTSGLLLGAEPAKPSWLMAKEVLDEHFDDDKVLREAARLLVKARSETPNDPNLYVQAARLTIKGAEGFAPVRGQERAKAYATLLEQALELDTNHKKALILRAEAYSIMGDLANELATLKRAERAPGIDRWLHVGWARYSDTVRDAPSAFASYEEIEKLGPGETQDQRNAFVYALTQIVRFRPPPGRPMRLKELAQLSEKHRSPKDHRTPAAFAQEFLFHGNYPEATEFARKAVGVSQTRNARLVLASALYGEAALQAAEGKISDAKTKATEAKAFGFPKEMIFDRLAGPSANFEKALPHLDSLLR